MISPVIFIGMHRSGTSMIVSLLKELGLHMGWFREKHGEAVFFLDRNVKLMSLCGANWEHPQPVDNLLQHAEVRERAKAQILRDMQSPRFLSYLGPKRWRSCGSIEKLNFPWGWKDPRNTFLLPLWLDIFPEAKVVHIYRHPIDVATSLALRQKSEAEMRIARFDGASSPNGTNGRERSGGSSFAMHRLYDGVRRRLAPLYRYDMMVVSASCSMMFSFDLWGQYVEKSLAYSSQISNPFLNVKYEDLLADGENGLNTLAQFCGLQASREQIKRLASHLNPDRRYAFKKSETACQIFDRVKNEPLVRKLGYDSVS